MGILSELRQKDRWLLLLALLSALLSVLSALLGMENMDDVVMIENLNKLAEDLDDWLDSFFEYVGKHRLNLFETKNKPWLNGVFEMFRKRIVLFEARFYYDFLGE